MCFHFLEIITLSVLLKHFPYPSVLSLHFSVRANTLGWVCCARYHLECELIQVVQGGDEILFGEWTGL